MRNGRHWGAGTCLVAAAVVLLAPIVQAQELRWMRSFGLPGDEAAENVEVVAMDGSSALYAAGTVEYAGLQEFPTPADSTPSFGIASSPSSVGYLRKYDAAGTHVWTRYVEEFQQAIFINDADVDTAGNSYVGGAISDPFADIFIQSGLVRRYDPNGNAIWTDRLGTTGLTSVGGVAVGIDGSVAVAGHTRDSLGGANAGGSDAFVRKYSPAGTVLWTRQFGSTANEAASQVLVDAAGELWVLHSVTIPGTKRGPDHSLMKLDPNGSIVWNRPIVTVPSPSLAAMTLDPFGNAYLLESIFFVDHLQHVDWVVRKYSPNGELVWTRQFGSREREEFARGITADASGLYVAGRTESAQDFLGGVIGPTPDLDPQPTGAFITRLTLDGVRSWTTVFGERDAGVRSIDVGAGILGVVGANAEELFAAEVTAGTSCSGTSAPESDETGPVSGPVHRTIEPLVGPVAPPIHELNCSVVASAGL